MRYTTRTTIASMVMLACAGLAQAGEKTVDNLTVFTNTKAASAEGVLKVRAARYGLPANLNNLVLVEVKESLTGKHYYYQQMLRGLPVDRAQIVVSISKNGDLQKIFNETRHISAKVDADAVNQLYNKAQISDDEALDKGWKNMKVQHNLVNVPSSTLVWVPTKDGVQLARKVNIEAEMPTGGFVQYLNAHDGSVIDSYSTSLPRTNKGGERSLAARAGEQGRGFAVVASEVRQLAQRSAAAAKEIKDLIVSSVEQVDQGSALVARAGSTMDEVVSSVQRVSQIMREITAAGDEQSAGIEQINRAVTEMDTVTQQNAALVEEAASAADALKQQAAHLDSLVGVFKLHHDVPRRTANSRMPMKQLAAISPPAIT